MDLQPLCLSGSAEDKVGNFKILELNFEIYLKSVLVVLAGL